MLSMKRVESSRPGCIVYQGGGGWFALAGLAILLILIGFLTIPTLAGFASLARRATLRARVVASPDGLRVTTRRWLGRHKEGFIATDELQELLIQLPANMTERWVGGAPVVARSDRTRLEFGAHLPDAEKQYIKAVIERVVTA